MISFFAPEHALHAPATEFFRGFLETALRPDELLTEIRVPKTPGAGWSFQKFNRRAMDWAIVGCAVVRHEGRVVASIGRVLFGHYPVPDPEALRRTFSVYGRLA